MDAVKKQENEMLRSRAAKAIAKLLKLCLSRTPQPNPKIVKNLIMYATADHSVTPRAPDPCSSLPSRLTWRAHNGGAANGVGTECDKIVCTKTDGILSLYRDRVLSEERNAFRRHDSSQSTPSTPSTPLTPLPSPSPSLPSTIGSNGPSTSCSEFSKLGKFSSAIEIPRYLSTSIIAWTMVFLVRPFCDILNLVHLVS